QLGATPGRDQAQADLGQPEDGVVGGHHQVAGQGQLGAAAEGEAGHGGPGAGPRPRGSPATGAPVGSGQRRTAANPRRNASRCTNQPWSSKPARCLRSAPTQKARSPAPVSTTAPTPGSPPSGSTAAARSSASSVEMALRASGRFRVTVATRLATSTRTRLKEASPADAAGVDLLERPRPGPGQPGRQVGLGHPAQHPAGRGAVQGDPGQLARAGRGEDRPRAGAGTPPP